MALEPAAAAFLEYQLESVTKNIEYHRQILARLEQQASHLRSQLGVAEEEEVAPARRGRGGKSSNSERAADDRTVVDDRREEGEGDGGARERDDPDDAAGGTPADASSSRERKYRRRPCSVDGCSNASRQGGVCSRHGARNSGPTCGVEGCARRCRGGSGVCVRHDPARTRKRCATDGCESFAFAKRGGLCVLHSKMIPDGLLHCKKR